jgi:hypothetical protein
MRFSAIDESPAIGPASPGLAWLGSVREVCYPLSRLSPIWVRESLIRGGSPLPRPAVPQPESHPYCEFTINLQGNGTQFIGDECQKIRAGSVMLLAPDLPHTAELSDYPAHAITIYILPILFLEMGPNADGARILKRFTAEQSMAERILYAPVDLWRDIEQRGIKMLEEFTTGGFGSELRMRSLLMELLVALLRWEESEGKRCDLPLPTGAIFRKRCITFTSTTLR